jgi:adenylate kinase
MDAYKKPLGELNDKELLRVQQELINFAETLPHGVVIFDTHHVQIVLEGNVAILTPKSHQPLISSHVVIEADPEIILARRIADSNIQRAYNLEIINLELNAERNAAYQIANETGARIYIVRNDDLDKTIVDISDILKQELRISG